MRRPQYEDRFSKGNSLLWVLIMNFAGSDPENNDDLQARALKRPRLVWTSQLHQRFVDAVRQLGLKNAVPKTIMQVTLLFLHRNSLLCCSMLPI